MSTFRLGLPNDVLKSVVFTRGVLRISDFPECPILTSGNMPVTMIT